MCEKKLDHVQKWTALDCLEIMMLPIVVSRGFLS
jgi:hypothetical protein